MLLPLLARHEIEQEIADAEREIADMADTHAVDQERYLELLDIRVRRLGKLRLQLSEMTTGLPE